MRRLRSLARRLTDAALDLSHAARAQASSAWARLRSHGGFPTGAADCAPIPVVLLPGILERWNYMAPLGRYLAAHGHPVHVVDGLGWNVATLAESVEVCLAVLRENDVHGAVLVAHSKGGLIGKAVLRDARLGDGALGLVAVATPFGGSTFGGPLQRLRLVQHSPLGLFSPTNAELGALAREQDVNARIVSLAPAWDQMIPGGSHLDGATNVSLTGRGHFRPIQDATVWELIHAHVHGLAERAASPGPAD
ncbi:MAG: hypothetical protein ABIS84_00380 [Arachnia sp.]